MRIILPVFTVFAFCAVAAPKRVLTPAEYAKAYHAHIAQSFSNSLHRLPFDRSPGAPGYGYPGTIQPYKDTPGLRENREYYNLCAGWFVRDPIPPDSPEGIIIAYSNGAGKHPPFPDRLPFLLFTPDASRTNPVPLVVFLPGNEELGKDLNRQFRQNIIFERVTSKAFQERHPCYLLVVSVPSEFTSLQGGIPCRPSLIQNLINDAILGVALAQQSPPVDTNRLYATDLSFGAGGVYDFGRCYPGRYAAFVPISGSPTAELDVHPDRPGNWWEFYNEGEIRNQKYHAFLETFRNRVRLQGGEYRVGTFPEKGHNAWDRAWREDVVWDWMFSKTADGTPVGKVPPRLDTSSPPQEGKRPPPREPATPPREVIRVRPTCTASVKGEDGATGPERGADGLLSTAYVSARGLKTGEYWQTEFPEPVAGRISLTFGNSSGAGAPKKAKVEVSAEGKAWTTALWLDKGKSVESFTQTRPVRFVRVTSTAPAAAPETLIVRNLVVE